MNSDYESLRTSKNYIELQCCPSLCQPHYHQAVEILVALEHEVYTLINNKEKVIQKGEICVADCFDVHSFNSYGYNVYVLIIPREFITDYLAVKGKEHLATPYITQPETCKKIITIIEEFSNKSLSRLTRLGYTDTIMGLIIDACGFEKQADTDVELMQKVLNYLEENYDEDINLDSLSAHFGYSKYYFSRLFNKFFKFNLNEYMSRLRIKRFISKMQKDPDSDTISTALDCGFTSWQTFYRCFKKYYNMSPKAYLKQQKKEKS